MSARNDLHALLESKCYAKGHDPAVHIDAYRDEVLREAAARIGADERLKGELEDLVKAVRRACAEEIKAACRTLPTGSDWFIGMFDAVALISPDKGES